MPLPEHVSNGDEGRFPSRIGNFTKGLPHDALGEVVPAAYNSMVSALASGSPANFETIPLGTTPNGRKFVNPQAGLAFELSGADTNALTMPPAPALESAEAAGEVVENYWMAHARGVHFDDYETDGTVASAAADLGALSDFRGPKTAKKLFRGIYPGEDLGPYLSQFLMLGVPAASGRVPFGAQSVDQRMFSVRDNVNDHMTDFPEWLAVQNGAPRAADPLNTQPHFIRNGRDLAQWVHVDALYQAYFNACLILLATGAPFDANNPYRTSATQDGFGTFGGPHILSLVTGVATRALEAVWFQKWYVHRRLRPEAYAGLVHQTKSNTKSYPIHADALNSAAVARTFAKYNSYLLPMAFPEGSPTHPAYGAGHATVAGACVTVLKAWFDESTVIGSLSGVPAPVHVSADGLSLQKYSGPDAGSLKVGGELNKLAGNIAIGRNFAGVHWRSDYTQSLLLGEQVAIRLLRDEHARYNESKNPSFKGLSLTTFQGETIVI